MYDQETEILKLAYDAGAKDEYERLTTLDGIHEFSKVCSVIEKYARPEAVIYDIGCGPGRYTEYLINKGYFVGCIDLSEKSLSMFNARLKGLKNERLLFSKACCASELDWIASDSADAILLLGPMYHITTETKRKAVISHCHRILKNGGHVISMFLSPYPALLPHNNNESDFLAIHTKKNCTLTTTSFKGFAVPQYRCWPKNAITEFQYFFTESDIVHIDEVKPPMLPNEGQTTIDEHYSHQYFVVYQKRATIINAE